LAFRKEVTLEQPHLVLSKSQVSDQRGVLHSSTPQFLRRGGVDAQLD
jgi:hypothetical protein